jgi:hypothetical protein
MVAKGISNYGLYLMRLQEVIWDRGGTEPTGEYTFSYGKENGNYELGARILCITESCQQLRGIQAH